MKATADQDKQNRDLSLVLTGAALLDVSAIEHTEYKPTSEFIDLWLAMKAKNGHVVWNWLEKYKIAHEEGLTAIVAVQDRLTTVQRMQIAKKRAEKLVMSIAANDATQFEESLLQLKEL